MSVNLTINKIVGELTLKSGETARLQIHDMSGLTFNIKQISDFPDTTLFQLITDSSGNASQDIQFTTDSSVKDIEIQAIQDWNPFYVSNIIKVHVVPISLDIECPKGDRYLKPIGGSCDSGYSEEWHPFQNECVCDKAKGIGETQGTNWALIAGIGLAGLIVIAILQSGILTRKGNK